MYKAMMSFYFLFQFDDSRSALVSYMHNVIDTSFRRNCNESKSCFFIFFADQGTLNGTQKEREVPNIDYEYEKLHLFSPHVVVLLSFFR